MIDALASLVACESPSDSVEGVDACGAAITALFASALGSSPSPTVVDGHTHLVWSDGSPTRVLLIGHYDTVWPLGTLARLPFTVADGRATGPGAFDMKAGIVQMVFALASLGDVSGVTVLLTSDEELGSQTSRDLVQSMAAGAVAALVLEPSAGGALKSARKGTGMYQLHVTGRASHAGLEPEKGINALLGLAEVVLATESIGRPNVGTTVTPTMASAGSASNVVPASATAELDVRVWSPEEADRVDAEVRALRTSVPGASLAVSGGPNRPPMTTASSNALVERAQACASRLGLGALSAVAVGGGSDGNFTAAVGTPTLDGLGAVGDGAHSDGEYVVVSAMPERAALVAELIDDLRG